MDIQDSSIPKPSPEVRIDLSSKDMATDQACQDSCKTTTEVHEEGSSQGMATDKASQDGGKTTGEVHEEGSSKGIVTDKASQDGRNTSRGNKEVPQKRSSEGTTTDKASHDDHRATGEVHKERRSEGMSTLREDSVAWIMQMALTMLMEVKPKAVVNKDNRSLFEAALRGDWRYIEKILNENDMAMTAKVMTIESDDLTMLDVAIMAAHDQLVEKLVKHFPSKCEDLNPSRALLYAARGGRIRMVKALLNKIGAESKVIGDALEFVTLSAPYQKKVIWHLARRTTSAPTFEVTSELIMAGHLDICLYLAHKYPSSMTFEDTRDVTYLGLLVVMTRYFRSGARLNFWENFIYNFIPLCLVDTSFDDSKNTKMARALLALNWIKISLWNLATIPAPFIKRIGELKLRHHCSHDLAKLTLMKMMKKIDAIEILGALCTSGVVVDAASRGVTEIVELCLKYFPELMWDKSLAKELIKEIVKGRHVELFRLMNAHNPSRCLVGSPDNDDSTNIVLMEAVVEWSPRCVSPDVSGAAFLLQRELQWFQAVEDCSFPSFKWVKFQVQRKPYWDDFVEQRKELHKEAQKWMKDTSSSCSLVATLITTVAFAAAFTVPGGNDNSTGIPIFLKNGSFMVFVVANALALFCSVTATLMFLAILTSCYAIEDFRHSLPRKMILGLTFLFLSLAFMLVAFGSTLTIVLSERLKLIYIPITLLASFPIILFAILQLPLYIEMVKSTFRPCLYRPRKLWK